MKIDNTSNEIEHKKAFDNARKIIGQRFHQLTVIGISHYNPITKGYVMICDCECGNKNILVNKRDLPKRKKSCGCLSGANNGCTYEFKDNYVIGRDMYNKEFYFDKEDYDLIKDINWHIDSAGYVRGFKNNKYIRMHNLICNSLFIDHINHQRNDNRKINLRIVSVQNNVRNNSIRNTNTSGVTGVHYSKRYNKWIAQITINGKILHLGTFEKFDDAVSARKKAENKYFKEYSYDNSMKIMEEHKID